MDVKEFNNEEKNFKCENDLNENFQNESNGNFGHSLGENFENGFNKNDTPQRPRRAGELKTLARQMLKGNWIKITIVFMVYNLLTSMSLTFKLFQGKFEISNPFAGGNMLIQIFLSVGLAGIFLYLARNKEFQFGHFKDGYEGILRTIITTFLYVVYVFLWMLLFIIPGIIAVYRYAMVPYILVDNKDLSANEVISESKRLMKGNKMEFFVLDLTFIGWGILAIIPIMVVSALEMYLQPIVLITVAILAITFLAALSAYMTAAHTAFYRDLIGETQPLEAEEA